MWYAEGNFFLVGSNHEVVFDLAAIERKLSDSEGAFSGLRKFGITTAESLLSHVIAAEDVLREQTAGTEENTWEKPVVEFYDFQDHAVPEVERKLSNLEFFFSVRGSGSAGDRIEALPRKVATAYEAEGAYLHGRKLLMGGGTKTLANTHFEHAVAIAPDNQDVRYHIFGHIIQTARNLMGANQYAEAEPYISRVVKLQPTSTEARSRYGSLLMALNQPAKAMGEFEALVALEPENISVRNELASFYSANNQPDQAIVHLRAILKIDSGNPSALLSLGRLMAGKRSFDEALDLLKRAHAAAPQHPEFIDSYAWLSYLLDDLETARLVVRKGELYYEGNPDFEKRRQTILESNNRAAP